jgi:hypothetical protein
VSVLPQPLPLPQSPLAEWAMCATDLEASVLTAWLQPATPAVHHSIACPRPRPRTACRPPSPAPLHHRQRACLPTPTLSWTSP